MTLASAPMVVGLITVVREPDFWVPPCSVSFCCSLGSSPLPLLYPELLISVLHGIYIAFTIVRVVTDNSQSHEFPKSIEISPIFENQEFSLIW